MTNNHIHILSLWSAYSCMRDDQNVRVCAKDSWLQRYKLPGFCLVKVVWGGDLVRSVYVVRWWDLYWMNISVMCDTVGLPVGWMELCECVLSCKAQLQSSKITCTTCIKMRACNHLTDTPPILTDQLLIVIVINFLSDRSSIFCSAHGVNDISLHFKLMTILILNKHTHHFYTLKCVNSVPSEGHKGCRM